MRGPQQVFTYADDINLISDDIGKVQINAGLSKSKGS